jgi:hypothetical protein
MINPYTLKTDWGNSVPFTVGIFYKIRTGGYEGNPTFRQLTDGCLFFWIGTKSAANLLNFTVLDKGSVGLSPLGDGKSVSLIQGGYQVSGRNLNKERSFSLRGDNWPNGRSIRL